MTVAGRFLRAATVVAGVFFALSLGPAVVFASPALLALFVWASFIGGKWMRFIYVPFAGLYAYVLTGSAWFMLQGKQLW